jgi:hypothetical protein
MERDYRATEQQWAICERDARYNVPSCILELRARIEALEAAQQPQQLDQSLAPPIGVKPQWLVDEQRLGDLKAAIKRREDRGVPVPLDWVIEVCEIRDRQKERRKGRGLREKVDLIVQVEEQYGQQPAPTVNDSLIDAPPAPDDRLRWCPTHGQQPRNAWGCPECVRELRAAAAPPAPADVVMSEASRSSMEVRDYLDSIKVYGSTSAAPPAPAGGLMERVKLIIAKTVAGEKFGVVEPDSWDGEARAAIREVAAWMEQQQEVPAGSASASADYFAAMLRSEANR